MRKSLLIAALLFSGYISTRIYSLRKRIDARRKQIDALTVCATIHKPPSGCPPTWTEVPNLFTEEDGTTESACSAPPGTKHPCIDVLHPGESLHFRVIVPFAREKPPTT